MCGAGQNKSALGLNLPIVRHLDDYLKITGQLDLSLSIFPNCINGQARKTAARPYIHEKYERWDIHIVPKLIPTFPYGKGGIIPYLQKRKRAMILSLTWSHNLDEQMIS